VNDAIEVPDSVPSPLIKVPKYRFVREQVRSAIESQQYGPGERLPADSELASRFETSRLTVIRALRDLEVEGLVRRRAGAGTFVAIPAQIEPHEFGLLIPDLGDGEIFEPVCRGMARAGESTPQALLWGNVSASAKSKEQQAEELCRYFISRKVSGVFFAPVELTEHKDQVNVRLSQELERAGIPLVMLDRDIYPFPQRSHYDLIGIDNVRAGYQITEQILRAGSRRVGFVSRPGSAPTIQMRIAGYREALWRHGLAPEANLIAEIDPTDVTEFKRFAEVARPDGIVCGNDFTAGQLMHSAIAAGLQIPHDLRMAGFDDVKYAKLLPVPLTTVHQPCSEIGAAAITAMLQRLEKPDLPGRDILLEFRIIVRQSCGGGR
jgi:GntR family transcriptional regulator, arabinose operon transcriptional repressor